MLDAKRTLVYTEQLRQPAAVHIAVRLQAEQVARLDALAARVGVVLPGKRVTRSDAMRLVIEAGLKELENKANSWVDSSEKD